MDTETESSQYENEDQVIFSEGNPDNFNEPNEGDARFSSSSVEDENFLAEIVAKYGDKEWEKWSDSSNDGTIGVYDAGKGAVMVSGPDGQLINWSEQIDKFGTSEMRAQHAEALAAFSSGQESHTRAWTDERGVQNVTVTHLENGKILFESYISKESEKQPAPTADEFKFSSLEQVVQKVIGQKNSEIIETSSGIDFLKRGEVREWLRTDATGKKSSITDQTAGEPAGARDSKVLEGLYNQGFAVFERLEGDKRISEIYFADKKGAISYEIYSSVSLENFDSANDDTSDSDIENVIKDSSLTEQPSSFFDDSESSGISIFFGTEVPVPAQIFESMSDQTESAGLIEESIGIRPGAPTEIGRVAESAETVPVFQSVEKFSVVSEPLLFVQTVFGVETAGNLEEDPITLIEASEPIAAVETELAIETERISAALTAELGVVATPQPELAEIVLAAEEPVISVPVNLDIKNYAFPQSLQADRINLEAYTGLVAEPEKVLAVVAAAVPEAKTSQPEPVLAPIENIVSLEIFEPEAIDGTRSELNLNISESSERIETAVLLSERTEQTGSVTEFVKSDLEIVMATSEPLAEASVVLQSSPAEQLRGNVPIIFRAVEKSLGPEIIFAASETPAVKSVETSQAALQTVEISRVPVQDLEKTVEVSTVAESKTVRENPITPEPVRPIELQQDETTDNFSEPAIPAPRFEQTQPQAFETARPVAERISAVVEAERRAIEEANLDMATPAVLFKNSENLIERTITFPPVLNLERNRARATEALNTNRGISLSPQTIDEEEAGQVFELDTALAMAA